MQNGLKLEDFLPENFNKAKECLGIDISTKLSEHNLLKKVIYKLERKRKNGIFYKICCFLFISYVLIFQYSAYYQNHISAKAILPLTLLFIIWVIVGWHKPLLSLSSIAQSMPPAIIIKKINSGNIKKDVSSSHLIKRIKIISIKQSIKEIFCFLLLMGCISYSLLLLEANPENNILNSFLSDLGLRSNFSGNLYMNYLIIILFLFFIVTVFSNIKYSYEIMIIHDKLRYFPSHIKFFIIMLCGLIIFQILPQTYRHIGNELDDTDIILLISLAIFTYLISTQIACFTFFIIIKLAKFCNHPYILNRKGIHND